MKRIGIIGGTFDPIHYGHLLLAEQAWEAAGLDQVIFVPARTSPYKKNQSMTDPALRLKMVKLAIRDHKGFTVSDAEINGPEISYTIRTLDAFQQELGPECTIYFICGTDAFLSMEGWMEAASIWKNYTLIVGARPRYKDASRKELIRKLENLYNAHIIEVSMPKIDISSSDIKSRVRKGKSIKYLLPPAVEQFIREHGMYRLLV